MPSSNQFTKRQLGMMAGVGLAVVMVARKRTTTRMAAHPGPAALATYLEEHAAGAEAAIRVVERLRRTRAHPEDQLLFANLFDEFSADREVVLALLRTLKERTRVPKRLAGAAAGAIAKFAAGGQASELSLLRTLEALSIGVQGKRCMWRVLQELPPSISYGSRMFVELESSALRQWEMIEARRKSVAQSVFGVLAAQSPATTA